MTTTEPIEVTLAVTGVLERLGVEDLVGGSLATWATRKGIADLVDRALAETAAPNSGG